MPEQVVLLVELDRDLGAPVDGWAAELARRGVAVLEDDLGRPAVERSVARSLFAEARESEARAARKRVQIEAGLVEADRVFRAGLPAGIPASAEVPGLTPAMLMMAADPMQGARRESVLAHALEHPAGAIVYHSIEGHSRAEASGE